MQNNTMQAIVFESEGKMALKEVNIPNIQDPEDVIVKIEVCSICGTDVKIMDVPPGYAAKPGVILGHEIVAGVVETGENVKYLKKGDRVVVNPNDFCGVCKFCLNNMPNQCESINALGVFTNGGFAEYARIPERILYKIAPDLSARKAVFAEPLACVINGLDKIRVMPGDSALVMGAGPIGLLVVQLLKASGVSPIIVSEPSKLRQEFAQKCGADYVIDPQTDDPPSFCQEVTDGGVDVVIELVGSQIKPAIQSVRKGGKVLLFGLNTQVEPNVPQSEIIFKEITLYGTWIANASFSKAVKVLEDDILDVESLITHTFPMSKTEDGLNLLRNGDAIEILIDPTA
jgi:2-desacetyl-2-hydroxyethyl bacteriochlorophyllide A dehydrogenase